jgi:hypothetical protein
MIHRPARALGYGFALLAWRLVAPLVCMWAWVRRPRVHADPSPRATHMAPADTPSTFGPARQALPPARDPHRLSSRLALPDVDCLDADPELTERHYPTVCALLQLGPHSKLLDLRAAKVVKLELFEQLAAAWKAPAGTVPRLGIVLGYEHWAVLRNVAARKLKPILDEGVAVEWFYAQQIDSVPSWFSHGDVQHDQIRTVLAWLRMRWRATASWPTVLGTTAMLVHAHAPDEDVPQLLLEICAIALSFGGKEAAEQAAGYARAALVWVGEAPSVPRCRALRLLATATVTKGEAEAGLALLSTAITTAMVVQDPIEEASALHQIGAHALGGKHFARAEVLFRRALALVSDTDAPDLRATLHHDLAIALDAQDMRDDDAEHHATAALDLRSDKESRVARDDRALLERIRARRLS